MAVNLVERLIDKNEEEIFEAVRQEIKNGAQADGAVKYQILQINSRENLMNGRPRFMGTYMKGYCAAKPLNDNEDCEIYKVNLKIYDVIYEGTIPEGQLESPLEYLFRVFNGTHPMDYPGVSLSVSDVVKLEIGPAFVYFFCDSFGWKALVTEGEARRMSDKELDLRIQRRKLIYQKGKKMQNQGLSQSEELEFNKKFIIIEDELVKMGVETTLG